MHKAVAATLLVLVGLTSLPAGAEETATTPETEMGAAEAKPARDPVPGAVALFARIPGDDPNRIAEAVGRWSLQLCRARFPDHASRCGRAEGRQLLVEAHVMGAGTGLTANVWVDERRLAATNGIPYERAGASFKLPLCTASRLLEPGERLSRTVSLVRAGAGCTEIDDPVLDDDRATLEKLRLLRRVVLAERQSDLEGIGGFPEGEAPPEEDATLSLAPEEAGVGARSRPVPVARGDRRRTAPTVEAERDRFVPDD